MIRPGSNDHFYWLKNHFRVINSVFETTVLVILYSMQVFSQFLFQGHGNCCFKKGLTVSWRLRLGHHTLLSFTSLKRKSSFFVWIVYQLKDRCEMEFGLWVGFQKKCASWPKHKEAGDLQYNLLSVIHDFVSKQQSKCINTWWNK